MAVADIIDYGYVLLVVTVIFCGRWKSVPWGYAVPPWLSSSQCDVEVS